MDSIPSADSQGDREGDSGSFEEKPLVAGVSLGQTLRSFLPGRSVQAKVLGSTFLVLLLLTLFTTIYYPARQRRAALQEMETRVRLLAEMVSLGVGIGLELNQLTVVEAAVNWAKEDPSLAYVHVADGGGQIFASYNPVGHAVEYAEETELLGAVRNDGSLLRIAVPIVFQERDLGVLLLGTSLAATQAEIASFRAAALLVSMAALILGSALALFLARRITEPLRRLRDAAHQVATGDLVVDIDRSGVDEVGQLAQTFALMVERVQEMLDQLEANSASLEVARDNALAAARAKADFLATMSHEIRTPMNGVIGMLGLVENTTLTPKQREYVSAATSSAGSLITVINDILDFSKLEAGKLEVERIPVDLRTVTEEVVQLLAERVHSKGLDLHCRIDEAVPARVLGDPVRLRQVLSNLCDNAVKFTQEGRVEVLVDYREEESPSGQVVIEVRDTGIGLSPKAQARLFEPFTQADTSTTRRFGGTGLGLSIVRRLVERMDGTLDVDSEAGQGSTFRFVFRTESAPLAGTRGEVDLSGVSVIVVDPSVRQAEVMEHYLLARGAEVTSMRQAESLTATLRSRARSPDVVIVDASEATPLVIEAVTNQESLGVAQLVLITDRGSNPAQGGNFAATIDRPIRRGRLYRAVLQALGRPEPEDEGGEPVAAVASLGSGVTARILLAEDHEINQQLAVEVLELAGFTVDVVADGRSAVQARFSEAYDVVLMDCQMPEMDGLEASRLIRSKERAGDMGSIPIVALTASSVEGDRERCLQAGMNDYLSKPFTPNELLSVLGSWLPGGQPSGPSQPGPRVGRGAEPGGPFDLERLRDLLSGNDDRIRVHLRSFAEVTRELLDELASAIDAGDSEEVRRLAHKAKGASGMVGAQVLTEVSAELEHSASAGDLGNARDLFAAMSRGYEDARDFARSF